MNNILIKWFMALNYFLIRSSRGRLGSQLGSQSILILHTVGCKTGRERAVPVAYFDYDGKYLLVGSNWGREKQADWFANIKKDPDVLIEVKGSSIKVKAHIAQGDEYSGLWKFVTEKHPQYLEYQKKTTRQIPIVVLE